MKSIRIKPLSSDMVSFEVSCECGNKQMCREITGMPSFSHSVLVNNARNAQYEHVEENASKPYNLVCPCGKRFQITTQSDHFHIAEFPAAR